MIARRSKIIAAAAVLALGTLAAWPLRRTEPLVSGEVRPALEVPLPPADTRVTAAPSLKLQPVSNGANSLVTPASPPRNLAITPANLSLSADEVEPAEVMHIVHEGDSLDRLARRYLDDEGRAMEIFELNRQTLSNPHLLPLGAELRIPTKARTPAEHSASGVKDVK